MVASTMAGDQPGCGVFGDGDGCGCGAAVAFLGAGAKQPLHAGEAHPTARFSAGHEVGRAVPL